MSERPRQPSGAILSKAGGQGAAARTLASVEAQALEAAPKAVEAIVTTLSTPERHSAAVISAGRTILELAGALGDKADLNRERRAFLAFLHDGLEPAHWEAIRQLIDGSPYAVSLPPTDEGER